MPRMGDRDVERSVVHERSGDEEEVELQLRWRVSDDDVTGAGGIDV